MRCVVLVPTQSIFTGKLSNQIVCMGGCGSIRTQPETYYCMSMQVQHKKNLEESLEHMVKVCAFANVARCGVSWRWEGGLRPSLIAFSVMW